MSAPPTLLNAVQHATRILAKSGDPDSLLRDVLSICVGAVEAEGGTIYVHDPAKRKLRFRHVLPEQSESILDREIDEDQGAAGAAFSTRQTLVVEMDHSTLSSSQREIQERTGIVVRNMITVPLLMEGTTPVGVVQLINKRGGQFNQGDIAVLDTVSAVAAMAFENARLVDHEKRTTSLIEMGKVGHDIGNLAASLNAVVSFIDLDLDEVRAAVLDESCERANTALDSLSEMSHQLKSSVNKVVSYSRILSDFANGKMPTPIRESQNLGATVEHSASYLQPEARKNHIEMVYEVDTNAPTYDFDAVFILRIVQNLVGNAIKAVRENFDAEAIANTGEERILGKVVIGYFYEPGRHVIEVKDSGPGMTNEVREKLLAGMGTSSWGNSKGTGWGSKIVLDMAKAHGGWVEIDSEPGTGATFRVIFPETPSNLN